MTLRAYSAYGTLIKRGDGGVGAGTQASRTIGTSNQQLKLLAKVAGLAGNSKTCSIIVSGNNTAFSISVTESNVTITSATDGSAAATTTVAQAISALYQNAVFDQFWQATVGSGTGSGVLVAGSSSALTGGLDGTEAFATIDGVRNLTGPQFSLETFDVTHHTSPGQYREVVPSFKSGGEVSFDLIYDPIQVTHEGLFADYENRVLRNFQMVLPDVGAMLYQFAAYAMGMEIQAPIDNALVVAVKLGITGNIVRTQ